MPYFCRIASGPIFYMSGNCFGPNTTKNLSLCSWKITKKLFRPNLLKKIHFSTLWIWLFGILDKRPQGCDEVKTLMGLLQAPRLMAWTPKSPVRRNHWVPWGWRAHLGSVKSRSILRAAIGLRAAFGKFLLHQNSSQCTATFREKVLTLAKSHGS